MYGLQWVLANRAVIDVVNMSLGRPGELNDNPLLRDVFKQLYLAGVVVIVSAGNDRNSEVSQKVPAGYPEVFAIASTTATEGSNKGCRYYSDTIKADTASYFTTDGALVSVPEEGLIGVTISAPGENREDINKACHIKGVGILSTSLGGGTTTKSGTSMAAPHVAGVVARMIQKLGSTLGSSSDVEWIRDGLRNNLTAGSGPGDSPVSGYTWDGQYEGVAEAPK